MCPSHSPAGIGLETAITDAFDVQLEKAYVKFDFGAKTITALCAMSMWGIKVELMLHMDRKYRPLRAL